MKIKYLHTMVRVTDIDASKRFFCDLLGLKEVRRIENEQGRFTLVFLAPEGQEEAQVELTYNWDPEEYGGGRNFGHLAYSVEDIYAACQKLQDGGVRSTGRRATAAWPSCARPTASRWSCCRWATRCRSRNPGRACPTRGAGSVRRVLTGLALAAAATAAASPAAACRLAMTIGMDISASIDEGEHALQREGLASALIDPDVAAAMLSGPEAIQLQIYEWSGRARQTVIVDWTSIDTEGDLERVATMLRTAPRADREFPTAIGQALVFAGPFARSRRLPEPISSTSPATARTTTASTPRWRSASSASTA
jgi:lactoylglutathione lyase